MQVFFKNQKFEIICIHGK